MRVWSDDVRITFYRLALFTSIILYFFPTGLKDYAVSAYEPRVLCF